MEVPAEFESRVARFESLGRWDRAELGRSLRLAGLSYGEIMELIPVPKGTLAGWCREIRLSAEQAAAISARTGSQLGVPRDTQWRRRVEVEEIRAEARLFAVEHLIDPFWVAGTVLYWGEGAKTKRSFSMANSDPAALRLFIRWTRAYVETDPVFVLKLNLHAGNDELLARRHWSQSLELEGAQFQARGDRSPQEPPSFRCLRGENAAPGECRGEGRSLDRRCGDQSRSRNAGDLLTCSTGR